MQKNNSILWLPTGGQIGDGVMILSVFAEMLARNPELKITYLVRRNAGILADLAAAYPRIEVIRLQKSVYGLWHVCLQIIRIIIRTQVVILPPHPNRHPQSLLWFVWLLRLRGNTVVGIRYKKTWYPCTTIVEYKTDEPYFDNLRRAYMAAGFRTNALGEPPRLQLQSELPKGFALLRHSYIVLHPFAMMSKKTLPPRRWRALLYALVHIYPDLSFVVTGSKENEQAAKSLVADLSRTSLAIGLPILEVAGVLESSALYIGVDTGISHIAGVLQVPSVIIAHQNDPAWLPSYNPNATLLSNTVRCVCGRPGEVCEVIEDGVAYRRCAYDVSDEAILEAVKRALAAR